MGVRWQPSGRRPRRWNRLWAFLLAVVAWIVVVSLLMLMDYVRRKISS